MSFISDNLCDSELDKQPHIYLSGWETLRGRRWSAWAGRWGCSQDEPQNSSRTQNSESLPEIQNNLSAIISQMGVLYLRGVERWAGERLLACDTLLYALLDIRPGWWWYELKYCLHLKRVWVITYYCTGSNTQWPGGSQWRCQWRSFLSSDTASCNRDVAQDFPIVSLSEFQKKGRVSDFGI